jgi:hypothetical protein
MLSKNSKKQPHKPKSSTKKTKRMSKEQLEDLLLSNYKPRRPSEEAIKTHNEMMKKLLPLIKEVFPDMEIGKEANEKKF